MPEVGTSTGLRGQLLALSVGAVGTLIHGKREVPSGFRKAPTQERLQLGRTGLDGDEQADLRVHGGPEKAVCVYPFEHYASWEAELGLRLQMPAFGENLTTRGLLESEVFLGDTFRWGGAILQVSQPRRPCFKVAARHGIQDLAVRVEDSLRTGFYFRVVQPSRVSVDDPLILTDVDPAGISVQDVSQAMNGSRSQQSPEEREILLARVLRSRHLLPERWVPILEKLRTGASGGDQLLNNHARLTGSADIRIASGETSRPSDVARLLNTDE